MKALARFIGRHSVIVLILTAGMTALTALQLPLAYDDDVVKFLPQDDPEVERLNQIMDRFGSLNLALVGIESPDLYTHERLSFVRRVTERLLELPEVRYVTSVTELAVITGEETGAYVELVPKPVPKDAETLSQIRRRVLSLDYLVGAVVSADGSSTRLVCQLATEIDGQHVSAKTAAEKVRSAIEELGQPDGVSLHYGGAPFIAEAAANGSQADLKRLAPYVVMGILLLILLSLGSVRAALLTVVCVGLGILWTLGIMGLAGEPLTLVSTSLPVILVALGSAYAVHLLVFYLDRDADVVAMLGNVGWPVVIAAATTMAGFLSFLVMDLGPMRAFGWQMALGAAICAVVSLFVLPAVLTLAPLPPRKRRETGGWVDELLVRMALRVRSARWIVVGVVGAIALFFAIQLPKVQTHMDTRAFFEVGSAPERADAFMTEHFGGSVFLQILVTGDIRDARVLHQMAAFEDRVRALDGVQNLQSIAGILAVVHESLKGTRRLGKSYKENALFATMAERQDPAVPLLVDREWKGALIQVALGGFDTRVVGEVTRKIRELAAQHLETNAVVVPRSQALAPAVYRDAAERIAGLSGLGDDQVRPIVGALAAETAVDAAAVAKAIRAVFEEQFVEMEMFELKEGSDLDKLARTTAAELVAFELSVDRFVALLQPLLPPDELADLESMKRGAAVIYTEVVSKGRPLVAGPILAEIERVAGEQPPGIQRRVRAIVEDTMEPRWFLSVPGELPAGAQPDPGATDPDALSKRLAATVSGYPILEKAMSESVKRNQINSLWVSLPLVLALLCIVFRSVIIGFIGLLPTGLTLLTTFGLMGLLHEDLPMDITSSMLASIGLGVGIDYAIHFLWRYRETGLRGAMRTTGRSIAINAGEITVGFSVLVFATIVPMSRFGLLTAQTLLVAAAATLILLPALLGFWKPVEVLDGPMTTPARGEKWKLEPN